MAASAELIIRKAIQEDLPEVFRIVDAAYQITLGSSGLAYKNVTRYATLEECERDLPKVWVGEISGVTCCMGKADVTETEGVRTVQIGPLAVDPKFQGKGYGKQLMCYFEAMAPRQELFVISCRPDLIGMYKKRGYNLIGALPILGFISKDRLTRTDLHMVIMERNTLMKVI